MRFDKLLLEQDNQESLCSEYEQRNDLAYYHDIIA